MSWRPGQPVVTAEDREAWQRWRRERKLQQQRERRARMVRIDFYADAAVAEIIRAQRTRYAGGDYSSILNRAVRAWAARGDPE